MTALPRFDFSGSSIKTEAELDLASGTKKKDTSKVLKPGLYDLTIAAVEYAGQAKDPNWGKLKLTLKGVGEKQILDWIQIPVKDTMYTGKNGKPTTWPFQVFRTFAEAVGVKVSVSNLKTTMTTLLGKEGEALVGKTVGAVIGYDRAYVNYAGKDAAGLIQFKITFPATRNQLETDLVGPDGKIMLFPDRNSANEHGVAAGITLSSFPSVLSYTAPVAAEKTGTSPF